MEPIDLSSALFLVDDETPVLVSEAELTELVQSAFDELLGPEATMSQEIPDSKG